MKMIYLTISLALAAVAPAIFSTAHAEGKTRYSIETDPTTFTWDGYALHMRVAPANLPHWAFGVGSYAMVFPDFLVNMNAANRNKAWVSDLRQGIGLFSEYYLDPGNKGWFIGGQLARHEFRVSKKDTASQHVDFTNALLMVHGGYRWYPKGEHLYIQPWAGLGYTKTTSGDTAVDSDNYDVDPFMLFATLHVGYSF